MSTSLTALLLAAAPAVSRVLPGRPRLLVIPLAVSVLCVLWIALLRAALPGFRPRHTRIAIGLSVTMVAAILLRFMLRSVAGAMGGSWFYLLVILPTAVLQVTVIASLMSAPFWVPLGLWAKRRLQRLPQVVPSPPQSTALGRPLPRALQRPVQVLRRIGVLPAPGAAPRITRREVLLAAPWVVPAGAFVGSLYGVGYESRHVVLRQVKIRIPGLPPALAGLRIGQVTDIHIARLQTQMRQLERALQLLADARVDLLCPTGDLCDEPRVHLDVLRLIQSMPARLGHFACLGNHELYLGDLDWVRRCYDRAKIHLLEDESVLLDGLRLVGLSYPSHERSPRMDPSRVPALLDEALREQRREETTVLLSHHPHTFPGVAGRNVALQISGHTHGGQVGFGERGWIEPFYPNARGHYKQQDGSQLYVSSGLGHWLPFRLNCPPEAVIIELQPA